VSRRGRVKAGSQGEYRAGIKAEKGHKPVADQKLAAVDTLKSGAKYTQRSHWEARPGENRNGWYGLEQVVRKEKKLKKEPQIDDQQRIKGRDEKSKGGGRGTLGLYANLRSGRWPMIR